MLTSKFRHFPLTAGDKANKSATDDFTSDEHFTFLIVRFSRSSPTAKGRVEPASLES